MSTDLNSDLIDKLRIEATQTNSNFIELLQETLSIDADEFTECLSSFSMYPKIEMNQIHSSVPDFKTINFSECIDRECLALRDSDNHLKIVIADPFNQLLREWLWNKTTVPFSIYITHLSNIRAFLALQEESHKAIEGLREEANAGNLSNEDIEVVSLKTISEDSSNTVKLVHATLYDALKAGASDIHLETTVSGLTIKYRMDGLLSQIATVNSIDTAEQVISRLKVMSELDISERRIPQDGRFKVIADERSIDFRVSVMPSILGEDVVLRILDKQTLANDVKGLNLEVLGFSGATLSNFRRMCNEPYGMVLVTGPTGSGKTTTLYAAVSEINHGKEKIITIEDPVEYQLPGVLQIPVNEKKGLTFAKGLRSILRHDPDKILVGEIRDSETAQIAIQSALTGHLVFTTVHANNVIDVLGRFMHMGVDPYSFISALNGILAQRLVRVNCSECSQEYSPSPEIIQASRVPMNRISEFNFKAGKGCGKCRGTGYKGRTIIAELLTLNDEIRDMIVSRKSMIAIKEAAIKNNTQFLRQSAMELVKSGKTTLEEINRVTFIE